MMVRILNKKFAVGCLVVIFSYLILVNYAIWIQGYVGELTYVKIFISIICLISLCPVTFNIIHDLKQLKNKSN